MKNSIYIVLLIFCSCSSANYYSRYRVGGHSNEVPFESKIPVTENSEATAIFPIENHDQNRLTKREKTMQYHSFKHPQQIAEQKSDFSDTTINAGSDSSYEMDEALAQAYASPAMNGLAAIFGALVFVNANFIWLAAVFYIGASVCILVGIIGFFIALSRYSTGQSDRRNKKFLWLWLLVFLLSLFLAITVLLMLL